MAKNFTDPPPELDISWRTRELGPEMRRALFRKAAPSVKLAAEKDPSPRAQGQQQRHDGAAAPEHGGSNPRERHGQAPRSRDPGGT